MTGDDGGKTRGAAAAGLNVFIGLSDRSGANTMIGSDERRREEERERQVSYHVVLFAPPDESKGGKQRRRNLSNKMLCLLCFFWLLLLLLWRFSSRLATLARRASNRGPFPPCQPNKGAPQPLAFPPSFPPELSSIPQLSLLHVLCQSIPRANSATIQKPGGRAGGNSQRPHRWAFHPAFLRLARRRYPVIPLSLQQKKTRHRIHLFKTGGRGLRREMRRARIPIPSAPPPPLIFHAVAGWCGDVSNVMPPPDPRYYTHSTLWPLRRPSLYFLPSPAPAGGAAAVLAAGAARCSAAGSGGEPMRGRGCCSAGLACARPRRWLE